MSPEQKVLDRIRRDPVWFCREILGFQPWSKQREILEALRDHDRVAVRSAHGVGKTATAARAVLWFLLAFGPKSCQVVTTAPTWDAVRDLLWKEIRVSVRGSKMPFGAVANETALRIRDDWFAKGISTDTPERFAGHHADHLLLVVDEASGVDEAIYEAAQGFLTGGNAKVLLIGNPTRTVGTFRRCFDEGSGWHQIHISAFDSPDVTGEPVGEDAGRAFSHRVWIAEKERDWGVESAKYAVRVLGEFAAAEGRPVFHDLSRVQKSVDEARIVRIGRLEGAPFKGSRDGVTVAKDARGNVTIYRLPDGSPHVIFADPAGVPKEDVFEARDPRDGDDYCCAQVIRRDTGEQVAELHGRWPTGYAFAHDLARLGYVFQEESGVPAKLAVEATGGYGTAAIEELRDRVGYRNLYRQESVGKTSRQPSGVLVGWSTNVSTRPLMVDRLQRVALDAPELIKSAATLAEMRTFVYDKAARSGAAPGCHDDRVMALAGAHVVRMTADPLVRLGEPRRRRPSESVAMRAPRVGAAA